MAYYPIPGELEEWVETSPTNWERTGHPEDGIIGIAEEGLTFEAYYAQRQLPNQGDTLEEIDLKPDNTLPFEALKAQIEALEARVAALEATPS